MLPLGTLSIARGQKQPKFGTHIKLMNQAKNNIFQVIFQILLFLEQRKYKNNSIQSTKIPSLKLPLFLWLVRRGKKHGKFKIGTEWSRSKSRKWVFYSASVKGIKILLRREWSKKYTKSSYKCLRSSRKLKIRSKLQKYTLLLISSTFMHELVRMYD